MGFGLCFVGFFAVMLDSVGLDAVGYALIGFGFLKVSRELTDYKGYKLAGYAALAAAPAALLSLYSFLAAYTAVPELPVVVTKTKTVYLCALSAAFCIAHCQSTASLAARCGGKVFSLRARVTLYVSALYYAANIAGVLFGAPGGIGVAIMVGKYLLPFLNALLLLTCFTTVTTKGRAVRERQIIKEQAEILERKRLNKRRKDKKEED